MNTYMIIQLSIVAAACVLFYLGINDINNPRNEGDGYASW